jgi:hypothetical protein
MPLFLCMLMTFAADLSAQDPMPGAIARQRFNQVFVKVIMPATERTPKQDGPVVESWVAEQLAQIGVSEYSAVTDWVPVCDAMLADDEVNNRVWSGQLVSKAATTFCSVSGDLPERKDGRVVVRVDGWLPVAGYAAEITLADEPGIRAVEPVMDHSFSGEKGMVPGEKSFAYVAILVGPKPQKRAISHCNGE